eukprot:1487216-Pyramimonas_sp.AAC.4
MDACAMDGGEMDYLQFLTVLRRVKELRAEEATAEKVRVTDRRSELTVEDCIYTHEPKIMLTNSPA